MPEDCPNCRRNQVLASQMRGLADAIVMGGLTAVGVPRGIAAAAPSAVEAAALKVSKRPARKNGWNQFLKRYRANYKRKYPNGKKTFGQLSSAAAREWRRANK
jgi:hypothetical protein